MRENKKFADQICSLYSQGEYSMSAIAEKLKVSPSKVKYCLEKHNILRRNQSEAGYLAHLKRFNKFPARIKKKIDSRQRELLTAGVMLYWAEGWKNDQGYIALSNSDPKMIQIFLEFLRKICGVYENRLHILLHSYEDQDEDQLKRYWSRVSGIPQNQFNAGFVHKGKRGSYKRRSKYGTVSLRYCDKKLLNQILQWINDYQDQFLA